MLSHCNVNSFKEKGSIFFHNLGKYCIMGGVAVNCYILLAPESLQNTATCERAQAHLPEGDVLGILKATFLGDMGLYVFNTFGAMRGIVIPAGHALFNRILKSCNEESMFSDETLDLFDQIENSALVSLTLAIKAQEIPVPDFLKWIFTISSLATPIARVGLQRFFPEYPTVPSFESIANTFENRNVAFTVAGFEALYTGLRAANMMSLITYFCIDNFYDAGHELDFPYNKELMLAFAAGGLIMGGLSISRDLSHRFVTRATTGLAMFNLIAMPLISTLMCLDVNLQNTHTFYDKAIYDVLAISAFAVILSYLHSRLAPHVDVVTPVQSVMNIQNERTALVPELTIFTPPSSPKLKRVSEVCDLTSDDLQKVTLG